VNPIYPYQTQEVRDLAWACFSPSLFLTHKLITPELLTNTLAGDGQNVTDCGLHDPQNPAQSQGAIELVKYLG
jgi:hypothetical protein